jgi:predicted TPR repeat methyltransferase
VVTGEALPPAYFDQLYAANADPWDFAGRWYESRKRAITMASLPRHRFRRAFEPGCSIGLLSELLADRCDELIAADVSDAALRSARVRLADRTNVDVQLLQVPEQWPDGRFDLIVISEIAYYCDESGAELLGRKAGASLSGDGVLVLCHWLHPVADYPLAGDTAQRAVSEASGLRRLGCHEEEDFRLEVLVPHNTRSVAAAEGLAKQP